MRTIQRWLDRFCLKHPRLSIPGLMRYIIIGNVIVYLLNSFSLGGTALGSAYLDFDSEAILHGQVWRLVTFIFVPPSSQNVFFFAITLYFYYFIGTALEREWGSNKFTIFYFFGVLVNILVGFLLGRASMYYVNMSMFFAFATLFPNLQFLLFFIIPVKAKWLAWFDAAYFAFAVVQYLLAGRFLLALMPIVAVLNYLLFFASDIFDGFSSAKSRVQNQARQAKFHSAQGQRYGGPKVVNFHGQSGQTKSQ